MCAPHQSDVEGVHTVQARDANTCRTSRLNDRDAKACLTTNWTIPEPEMNECVDRQAPFWTATVTCHAHKGADTHHKPRLKRVRKRNCAITSDVVSVKVELGDGLVGLMTFEGLAYHGQTQATPNTYTIA